MRKHVCILVLVCTFWLFVGGCNDYARQELTDDVGIVQSKVDDIVQSINKVEYGTDETINLLRVIEAGNMASAPFNPYALPIGAGLSGIIAMLEALRRVEKGKRKYAEHELNNNNKRSNNG